MNAKPLITALTLALAGIAAHAGDSLPDTSAIGTPKTRAEVKAEVLAARADGTLRIPNDSYDVVPKNFVSTRTRDEVRAEARAAAHQRNNSPSYGG